MQSYTVDTNFASLPSSLEEQIRYAFASGLAQYNIPIKKLLSTQHDLAKIKFAVFIVDPHARMHLQNSDLEGEVRDQETLLFDGISRDVREKTGWIIADFEKLNKKSAFIENGERVLKFCFTVRMKGQG